MTTPHDDEMREADYARAAEEAYAHRDEVDDLEEVEFEIEVDVRSVVSVRFNRGELKRIEQAAAKAGMPVSTFIRNAALATSETVDLDAAREALLASQRSLKEAIAALSHRRRRPAA
jgi:predicted DNA binding CopG/RHH family protein